MLEWNYISHNGRAEDSGIFGEHFKHLRALGFDLNLIFAFYYPAIDHSYISRSVSHPVSQQCQQSNSWQSTATEFLMGMGNVVDIYRREQSPGRVPTWLLSMDCSGTECVFYGFGKDDN